jgi:hypothetical protein
MCSADGQISHGACRRTAHMVALRSSTRLCSPDCNAVSQPQARASNGRKSSCQRSLLYSVQERHNSLTTSLQDFLTSDTRNTRITMAGFVLLPERGCRTRDEAYLLRARNYPGCRTRHLEHATVKRRDRCSRLRVISLTHVEFFR